MEFVFTPNLPQKAVSHCIIGRAHSGTVADLFRLGITSITSPPFGCTPIASHADIVCHHLGGRDIVVYPYNASFTETIKSFGFNVIFPDEILGESYPFDVLLNAARVGERLICNSAHTATVLVDRFTPQNIIDVKQGYAKCSTLVVSSCAIVTSDATIAKNALEKGIKVLRIRAGFIPLEGYDYGFIGGCGALISEKLIYFTGDIYAHPDGVAVVRFLRGFGIDVVCGSAATLVDVGSVLPVIVW